MPKIEENDQTTHRHPEHQPDETRFRVIRSEEVIWRPFPPFPPAARIAILVGDPTREGLFVIRVKLSAGTKMLPHRHSEDRIYTVFSGVFYIGLGDEFDESKLSAGASRRTVTLPLG